MCPIVNVSAARRTFYRLSASRSASQNVFLSLPEQLLPRVLEDEQGDGVRVFV